MRVEPGQHRSWDPLPLRPSADRVETVLEEAFEEEQLVVEVTDCMVCDGPLKPCDVSDNARLLTPSGYVQQEQEQNTRATHTELVFFGNTREGASVCARVQGFRPRIRLAMPASATPESVRSRLGSLIKRKFEVQMRKLPNLIGCDTNIDQIPEDAPLDVKPTWTMHTYADLTFDTISAYRSAKRSLSNMQEADAKTPLLNQALLQTKTNPADLIRLSNFQVVTADEQVSHCQIEIIVGLEGLSSAADGSTFPKLVMAYDGEMFSHTGMMCKVTKGDPTFCISAVYAWTNGPQKQEDLCKVLYYVGAVDVPEEFLQSPKNRVRCFENAAALFEAFRNDVIINDPDIITGWNNYGFDNPYFVQEYLALCQTIDFRLDETEVRNLVIEAKRRYPAQASRLVVPPFTADVWRHVVSSGEVTRQKVEAALDDLKYKHGDKIVSAMQKGLPIPAADASRIQDSLRELLPAERLHRGSPPSQVRDSLGHSLWSALLDAMPAGTRDMLKMPDNLGSGMGMRLSRIRADICREGHKRMRSAAKGDNYYSFFKSTMSGSKGLVGRCQCDMMQMVKDRDQPSSNALKHAAEIYLQDETMRKQDLDYHEMFDIYRLRKPEDQWRVLEYCWYDSAVCIWVGTARGYWTTVLQEARVTQTRIDDIFNGGQQIKVYSALAHICSGGDVLKSMRAQPEHAEPLPECGFAINGWARTEWPVSKAPPKPVHLIGDEDDPTRAAPDYKGAVVLPPKPKFYQDPVASLDFASLYPSVIRSDNLCFSTIFLDSDRVAALAERKDVVVCVAEETSTEEMNRLLRENRVVISRYTITHTVDDKEFDRHYYIDQSRVGVLPRILNHLHAWRKDEKKLKKSAKDKDAKELHDKRQLGIKLVMNSLYGFLGVSQDKGMMPCKPLAAIVTCVGRSMIEATKEAAERLCEGAYVVYGDTDSVMVRLPRDRFPTLDAAWAEGDRLASIISKIFRPPHDLEHEELKWPFMLTPKKKTYAARAWEPAKGGGYVPHLLIKGLDPVRKDRVKISRDLVTSVLGALLGSGTDVEQGDKAPKAVGSDAEQRAAMIVARTMDEILQGSVPLESFVLSRSTRASYKDRESNVAPMVRDRMIERGDPDVPPIGARVPYVITTRGGAKAKQAVSADSPAWFAEHGREQGLDINYKYYINLLRNPLNKILQYTSVPVDRVLDVAESSLGANRSACVMGKRSQTPVQDFLRGSSKRVAAKVKPGRRRVLVGRRRR